MKHLYFVRHGLSVMNQQRIWSGQTDTPLTEEGVAQCHAAGQALKDAGIDCIISSPQHRALHTAQIIAEEIGFDPANIKLVEALQERDFGPLEGTAFQPDATDLDNTEGVEHSEMLMQRVAEGLEYIRGLSAENVLVVSHGAIGRAMRAAVDPDTTFHTSKKFHNAEVVQLQ